MPLVTRQSNLGTLIVEDTEPPNPSDGDIWTDIGQNPPIVKVNDDGTFRPVMQVGTFVQGDTVFANANNTLDRLAKGTDGQFLKIGGTIPEWADAAAVGSLELIESHIFTGSETNFTVTKTFDPADFSAVIIYCGGALADILGLRFNAVTSNYVVRGRQLAATPVDYDNVLTSEMQLTNVDVVDFQGWIMIFVPDGAATRNPFGVADIGGDGKGWIATLSKASTAIGDITSITMMAVDGTTNFASGSHFSVYGVKRT